MKPSFCIKVLLIITLSVAVHPWIKNWTKQKASLAQATSLIGTSTLLTSQQQNLTSDLVPTSTRAL